MPLDMHDMFTLTLQPLPLLLSRLSALAPAGWLPYVRACVNYTGTESCTRIIHIVYTHVIDGGIHVTHSTAKTVQEKKKCALQRECMDGRASKKKACILYLVIVRETPKTHDMNCFKQH